MERSHYETTSSDVASPNSPTPEKGTGKTVLSIECLKASSNSDGNPTGGDMLQTGDIVEEIRLGNMTLTSPFKGGKHAIQKILQSSFKQKENSITVRVRRGGGQSVQMDASIVVNEQLLGRKQYILRAKSDLNYAVGFVDRTESECLNLQVSQTERMVNDLEKTQIHEGYVPYPWERRMEEMLSIPNSSSFFSILLLPKASTKDGTRYNDLEDTLARAHAWLYASSESGAPISFVNIQTESLLTKISGDTASSTVNAGSLSDLSNLANTSLYGFEDYHGVDIGVVRAVRLWFSPMAGEIPIEIKIKSHDTKLGFTISRTEEGFIYISSVIRDDNDVPSVRSGLTHLHNLATSAARLLVVSRVSNMKVLPWMVSQTGAIRCFDTFSLSQKLSLQRRTKVPIALHVFLWDRALISARHRFSASSGRGRTKEIDRDEKWDLREMNELARGEANGSGSGSGSVSGSESSADMLQTDTAGEFSFRFQEFQLNSNWV